MWPEYLRFRADLLSGYESLLPLTEHDRRELDLYQAIPFIVWLNRGLKQDADTQEEFGQWVGPTLSRIGQLCGLT